MRHAPVKILSLLALLASLCSCSKLISKEPHTLVLRQPCYFIDNPGKDNLLPLDASSSLLESYKEHITGTVSAGTRIKHLGAFEESDLMMTRTNHYARILSGEFKGRKVSFDWVIRGQEAGKHFYDYDIK